jgi:hypothetical protein
MSKFKLFLILSLALLLVGASSTAWAGAVGDVSVNPTSLTVQQNSSGTFNAQVNSLTGKVPSTTPNAPQITYCVDWTIHNDGSISCNSTSTFDLERGRNYTQNPLTSPMIGLVTVNVDPGVPCTPPNNVYTINEVFTTPDGAGVDFGNGVQSVTKQVTVTVTCQEVTFGGCSHGYWKHHVSSWTGYTTSQTLGTVFTINATDYPGLADHTLMQALENTNAGGFCNAGGAGYANKANALMCQAVAGLLNAASPDVNYPLTTSGVISLVNGSLATKDASQIISDKDTLEGYNTTGCPFDDPETSSEQ